MGRYGVWVEDRRFPTIKNKYTSLKQPMDSGARTNKSRDDEQGTIWGLRNFATINLTLSQKYNQKTEMETSKHHAKIFHRWKRATNNFHSLN
jgi:hypothetical protein